MYQQDLARGNRQRHDDDWDEVHNQIIELQNKERIQKKSLEVSNPDDRAEKEADEIARKVTSGESVHVDQGRESVQLKIQRITPEDVSTEMTGKKFTLDKEITETMPGSIGAVTFPVGQVVTVQGWSNTSNTVYVKAFHEDKKRNFGFSPQKNWLTPVGDKTSGLYQYSAGVSETKGDIASGEQKIADWKLKEAEYQKAGTMDIYAAELKRLEELQAKRFETLNSRMIQETMFNAMDVSIKKWTDYYNQEIGKPNAWSALDANLVKAMVWKESGMGTTGQYLPLPPYAEGARMTRFNVMQAVDSSGPQQIIMMNENDTSKPSLEERYKYNQVPLDLEEAKRLNNQKSRTLAEEAMVAEFKKRCYNASSKTWRYNDYFTKDPRWYGAVTEFFKQTNPPRNLSYDYWIQTGVRWLFEKRKSVSTWDDAIAAYNGSGPYAIAYKNKIKGVTSAAKTAAQSGKEYIPK